MLTITRALARRLRSMFQRAGICKVGQTADCYVHFHAGPAGLVVQAQGAPVSVAYHDPEPRDPGELLVPFDALIHWEGRGQDLVALEISDRGRLVATWTERGLPQLMDLEPGPASAGTAFLEIPNEFTVNGPELLLALRNAIPVTDQTAGRYALGCLQLDGGHGRIAATDGRHLFVEVGFQFPWTESLLIPAAKILSCKELPENQPVEIGATQNHVALRIGPWTIWLAINVDGRFPRIQDLLRTPASATSKLQLSEADADFLARALPQLPCDDVIHSPVTLDMNGQVLVRAAADGKTPATELALCGSQLTGTPVVINTNREYLTRAVALGFREICAVGNDTAIFCDDGRRHYLWMPLDANNAVKADGAIRRIESAATGPTACDNIPKPKRRRFTVKHPPTPAAEPDSTLQTAAKKQPADNATNHSPIMQAMALRTSLRTTLARTGELIHALKRQQRQSKLVASTLASLKELQKVAS